MFLLNVSNTALEVAFTCLLIKGLSRKLKIFLHGNLLQSAKRLEKEVLSQES